MCVYACGHAHRVRCVHTTRNASDSMSCASVRSLTCVCVRVCVCVCELVCAGIFVCTFCILKRMHAYRSIYIDIYACIHVYIWT